MDVIENQIQKFIEKIRPPVAIRKKLDIGYSYNDRVLEIFEIRPRWDNKKLKMNSPVAKTRFVKSKGVWIIYWMRASGKWVRYKPNPEVKTISKFFEILKTDKYGCFWG